MILSIHFKLIVVKMINIGDFIKQACISANNKNTLILREDGARCLRVFASYLTDSAKTKLADIAFDLNKIDTISTLSPHYVIYCALGIINGDFELARPVNDAERQTLSEIIYNKYQSVDLITKEPALRNTLNHTSLRTDAFYEVIAKKIARSSMPVGARIVHVNPEGKRTCYNCSRIIHREGLRAYVFDSNQAEVAPFVVFRPTVRKVEDDGFKSVMEDCHDKIGIEGYNKAKQDFTNFFAAIGKKVHLVGFSLGGAHAARVQADFPQHISKAYYFNDPSCEEEVNFKFLNYVRTHTDKIEIHIYHHANDLITWLGQMHIGYKPEAEKESLRHLKVRYHRFEHDDQEKYAKEFKENFLKGVKAIPNYVHIHTDIHISPELIRNVCNKKQPPSIELQSDRRLLYYRNRGEHIQWYEKFRQNSSRLRATVYYLAMAIHHICRWVLSAFRFTDMKFRQFGIWIKNTSSFLASETAIKIQRLHLCILIKIKHSQRKAP